jgi:hypothetical protein
VRDKNEVHPGILAVILAGVFGGGYSNVFLAMRTFISIDTLFLVFATSGVLTLAMYYILRRRNRRYFLEMAAFSFAGVGSLITALMLALNFFFYHDRKTDIFTEHLKLLPPAQVVLAKDNSYKDFPYLLYFESLAENEGRPIREIDITTATGLFGYRIVLNREIVYQ